jgi:hypothetical protein
MQADSMLNLPFALCVLLLILSYSEHSFIKIFLSGILFALALMFKYTVISFLPLVVICFLISANDLKSIRIKNIFVFLFGTISLCGAAALWYSFAGGLSDMLDIQFGQTSQYTKIAYETETGEFISSHIIRLFTYSVYSPLIWFSFAGFFVMYIKRKLDFRHLLIFSWILSSLFSLIVQWKFYHYHFLVIIAPISIGAVLFVSLVKDYAIENKKKVMIAALGLISACFVIYAGKPYVDNYNTLFSFASGKLSLKDAYIKNGITTDSVFMIRKTFNTIDYVNQNSIITDNIFVWGYDPLVYYLTGRHCVSRFVYHIPLLWKAGNDNFRKEFMVDMNNTNPKLIVIANNDPLYYISGYNEDSKQLLERFPEFNNFITEKYIFKKRIDDYDLYEIKNW